MRLKNGQKSSDRNHFQPSAARRQAFPERFGFREAYWVCHYSLAELWSGLVSFSKSVERARHSVHYNI